LQQAAVETLPGRLAEQAQLIERARPIHHELVVRRDIADAE
jgi:hypothetical protein